MLYLAVSNQQIFKFIVTPFTLLKTQNVIKDVLSESLDNRMSICIAFFINTFGIPYPK